MPRVAKGSAQNKILAYLQQHGASRRGEIRQATGLAPSSLNSAFGRLQKSGVLVVSGADKSRVYELPAPAAKPRRGRPPGQTAAANLDPADTSDLDTAIAALRVKRDTLHAQLSTVTETLFLLERIKTGKV